MIPSAEARTAEAACLLARQTPVIGWQTARHIHWLAQASSTVLDSLRLILPHYA